MGRAPGSRAHPLPVPVAGSLFLACSGASVSIVHFKSDPGMSKARCLLASVVLADAGAMRRLVESREFRQLISGSTASTLVSILFDNTKHDSTRLRRVDVTTG